VADRNRGRSVDDDDPIDEGEDAYDDADLADDELGDELDEEPEQVPARRSRAGAATRERTELRSRTRVRDEARPRVGGRLVRRFRETVAELQKVIWPTRKELLTYTTVVVVFVTLVMSYVAGLDVGFARLMFLLFGQANSGQ
jgi:preprotein translocase subunit SecE